MLSPILLAALCALALLVAASVRRIPEGHVYALRRRGGQVRLIGSGMHLVLPLLERVVHKISLGGASLAVDGLALAGQAYRAVVYYQVVDPARAEVVIEGVEELLRSTTRQQFGAAELPEVVDARLPWLKQALNAQLRQRGLLVARVDLAAQA